MRAGKMDMKLLIRSPLRLEDSFSGPQPARVSEAKLAPVFAEVWGQVQSLVGREVHTGRRDLAEVTHRIRIRWIDGVRPQMWIEEKETGRLFDIKSIEPQGRHRELRLICQEAPEWTASESA